MDKKLVELLEDERARHEGRYYDAGAWFALNWVLEDAEEEAVKNNASLLDIVSFNKRLVIGDLKEAKAALNNKKVERVGKTRDGNLATYPTIAADGAKASFLAGEIEGLEKAVEIMKEFVKAATA